MNEKTIYVKLAEEAITNFLNGKETIWSNIPDELKIKRGCFVTLHNLDGNLRGCIGTIVPVYENLYYEIINNAISSATRDYRFLPVGKDELNNIYISVDVLSELEDTTMSNLDPKKYGVVVSYMEKKGVLLPDIEGVDTVEYQLQIAMNKAGIDYKYINKIRIQRFTVNRYF